MEAFPEVDVWICPTCEAKAQRANRKVAYSNATEQEEEEEKEQEEEEEEEEEEDTKDEDYGVKKVAKGPARMKGKKMGEMKGWVMKKTAHPDYPELKILIPVKATKESAQKKAGGRGEEEEEELPKSPSSPTHKSIARANSEKDGDESNSTADNTIESGNEGTTPVKGKTSRRRSQSSRRSWATIYDESDTSIDEGDLQGDEEEFFDEQYSPVITKYVSAHAYSSPKSRGQEEDGDYCQRPSAQREKKQPGKEGSSKRSHASREPYLCPVLGCDCVCDNRTSMMSHSYVLRSDSHNYSHINN